jgi:hypothetical protein
MITRARIRLFSVIFILEIGGCIPEHPEASETSFDEQFRFDEIDSLKSDFNGDGFADLAIGIPGEGLNGVPGAGAVTVLYGSEDGLTTDGVEFWSAFSSGVGEANLGDVFGNVLAAGDFNNDKFADLAIAAFVDDVNGQIQAGSVTVLYGSCNGLTADGSQLWHQDSPGIDGEAAAIDHFGLALTTGDFDNDTYDDLAIGVPGDDIGSGEDAGAVHVIRGSNTGLTASNSQFLHQDTPGLSESAETSDAFGTALAAGHFNGDEFEDLAIGSPGEVFGDAIHVGLVHVLYGDAGGLFSSSSIEKTPPTPQIWHQDIPGIHGISELFDEFGAVLAAGDFNGDLVDDLAVGVPGEDVNEFFVGGAVNTIYGSVAEGLTAMGDQYWTENTAGIIGVAEEGDSFGRALAAADFDADGLHDLAIGSPGEDVGNIINAGDLHVLYGSPGSGLSAARDQRWHQNTDGIDGVAEIADGFAYLLSSGDFDGDGSADLAIDVRDEDVGPVQSAGQVNVIYGANGVGLMANGDQVWHQNIAGVPDTCEPFERFGLGLP